MNGMNQQWLVDQSELQVQLVSSPCLKEHALQLSIKQPCHVLAEAVVSVSPLSSQLEDPPHPPNMTAKVLDRKSGTCEMRDQGGRGIPLFGSDKQQIILYTARSPSFSETVSIRVSDRVPSGSKESA